MLRRQIDNKGFLAVAAIGVVAVLMIVVMGVAALVSQTSTSLGVYKNRSTAWDAVDMYLPGVLADYRAKGATSLTLEFTNNDITCSFTVNPAAADDAALKRLGLRAAEGDLLVTARAASANDPATRFSLLAAPGADGSKPYIILEATPEKPAAE